MRVTLAELACLLAGELEGDGQTIICGIAPLDQAQTGDVTFLTESKHAARLATSRATAVAGRAHASPLIVQPFVSLEPYLGFIHLLEHFFPPRPPTWGIDARAVIDPEVTLGAGVNIGPYVVIGRGVRLGIMSQCIQERISVKPVRSGLTASCMPMSVSIRRCTLGGVSLSIVALSSARMGLAFILSQMVLIVRSLRLAVWSSAMP